MAPLKIHNSGSYALVGYFTCWKCAIFHAIMASYDTSSGLFSGIFTLMACSLLFWCNYVNDNNSCH